ncbi:unnamed protein product [Owenia fusiformis]|uniref:FAD-binding PCMH-type domain-containing protein n=1 Tax=Owenia fusiformis TaxID=6347 RepID=A0A8S4NPR0_OWEFU|nr:unnamed protein product [Owenia fusiformis]
MMLPLNESMQFLALLGATFILSTMAVEDEPGPPTAEKLTKEIGFDITLTTIWDTAERQSAEIFWAQPTTVKQIKDLVKAARKFSLRVRPYGGRHSWAPLFADKGDIGLDLSLFAEGDKFTVDKERMLVSASASAYLHELYQFNTDNGVTIISGPNIDNVTLQGATGTSSHGQMKAEGTLATYVYAIDLVDYKGRNRHFDEDGDKEVITACRTHLGMCGIIYNTTIRVVKDTVVKFSKTHMKASDIVTNQDNRKAVVMDNAGMLIMWRMFTSATDEQIMARNTDPLQRPPLNWDPADDVTTVWTINPVDDVDIRPNKEPFEDKWRLSDGREVTGTADYRMASETMLFTAWTGPDIHLRNDIAWATAESVDFSASQKTIENFMDVYETAMKRLGSYRSFGIFRWLSHKDTPTLANTKVANDFNLVLELELTSSCEPCNKHLLEEITRDKVWSATVATGMMANNSRILPHWGKYFDFIPGIIDHLRQNYGTKLDEFIKIRNEADLDPDNMFTNSHLRTLFHEAIVRNAEKARVSKMKKLNTLAKRFAKLLESFTFSSNYYL